MHTEASNTFENMTDATLLRRRWKWGGIRTIAFWGTTFIIVFELVAGSVWNLKPIEWIVVQLRHLGYPAYLAYILGVWQAGAAVAIAVPGWRVLKEWAYAGSFFLWSGAVTSHLITGDGPEAWSVPLFFATCLIASWVLRPADRRLRAGALTITTGPRAWKARPRAWAVAIGLLVVLYVVSILTLPPTEVVLHERAIKLGWISR